MPPIADDPTTPAPKKKKPYFPKPPPPKPPTVLQHTSNTTAPAGKGNRAYAGRNPNVAPAYTPAPTRPVSPYSSSIKKTNKLATTAQALLNDPRLSGYWMSDIIQYRSEVMKDRRAQADANMSAAMEDYEARGRAAINRGRFNWVDNHEFDVKEARDMDRSPVDYSPINKQLEALVEKLRAVGPAALQDYTTRSNISYNFDKELENRLDIVNNRREVVNKVDNVENKVQTYAERKAQEARRELAEYAADKNPSVFNILLGVGEDLGLMPSNKKEKDEEKETGLKPGQTGLPLSTKDSFNFGNLQDFYSKTNDYEKPLPDAFAGNKIGEEDDVRVNSGYTDNSAGEFFQGSQDATWDQLEKPVETAIDVLSRPMNAVAEGSDELLSKNKDNKKQGSDSLLSAGSGLFGALTGRSPLDSVDELADEPSGVWDVVKAAGSGLANEYDGGFGKVIKNQAERDGVENLRDREVFQRWGGLAGDIAFDPLNFVGVGLVSNTVGKGSRLSRAATENPGINRIAKQNSALQKFAVDTWQQYRQIPSSSRLPDGPASVNDIYDIVSGNFKAPVARYKSKAEKIAAIKNSRQNLEALKWELENFGMPTSSKIRNLEELRATYNDVRIGMANEAEAITAFQVIESHLAQELDAGRMTLDDAEDVKSHLHTLGLTQGGGESIISKANAYNTYITNVAKNVDSTVPVMRDGVEAGRRHDLSAIERQYEGNRSAFEAARASGDLETADKLNKTLDSQRQRIMKAQDAAVGNRQVPDDVYDMLGPKWAADPRFTREETNKIYSDTYSYLNKNDETFAALSKDATAVRNQIRNLRNTDTKEAKNSLDNAYYRLNKIYAERNSIQAAYFIKALKAKVGEYAGTMDQFADPGEALRLLKTKETAQAKLNEPSVSYTGVKEKGDDLLSPDPDFFDSHQHMQSIIRDTDYQLEGLKTFNRKGYIQAIEKVDAQSINLGQRFPESLAAEDGSLDVERALQTLSIDPASLTVNVATKDPVEAIWAAELRDVVAERIQVKYMAEQEKITRARREAHRSKHTRMETPTEVDINNLNNQQQEVLAMFGNDANYGVNTINSKKAVSPVVTAPSGDRVALGSNKFKETFKTQIKPSDIKKADKYRTHLDEAVEWVKKPEGKLNTQALTAIRKYLQDAGVTNVPKRPEDVARFIANNRNGFREHYFDPYTVLGHRLFKEEHGMSVLDAQIARDITFPREGRVVHDYRRKAYVSIDEFVLAHNDFDSFKAMMEKSPFKVKYKPGMSEKEWRKAEKAKNDWYKDNFKAINDPKLKPGARLDKIKAAFKNTVNAEKNSKIQKEKWDLEDYDKATKGNQWIKHEEVVQLRTEAISEAREYTKAHLEQGDLQSKGLTRQALPIQSPINMQTNLDEIHDTLMFRLKGQRRQAQKLLNDFKGPTDQRVLMDNKIKAIDEQIEAEKILHKQRRELGKKTAHEYAKRLDEQNLLAMAEQAVQNPGRKLSVVTAVGSLPLLDATKIGSKAGSLADHNAIVGAFRDSYNKYFRPPSSLLGEFAPVYRERTAQSARRIQVNLEELQHTIGNYPTNVRKSFFKSVRNGKPAAFIGTADQRQALEAAFSPILNSLKDAEKIAEGMYVHPGDVNAFLPKGFKVANEDLGRINSIEDLLTSLRKQARRDAYSQAKFKGKGNKGAKKAANDLDVTYLDDPFEVAWKLRIGVEQARAKKAFIQSIGDVFGIRSTAQVTEGAKGLKNDTYEEAMQLLAKKGWRKVEEIGPHHYFPPDSAELVQKMVQMLEPRQLRELENFVDRVTGTWKAATTIYNPSYWVKNGIGEVYISYLAGVRNPDSYKTALKLVQHARGDGAKLEALKSLHPMMEHMKNKAPSGDRIAFTKGKEKISYDDLLVAYHENSLKTGFFDNDLARRHNKLGNWARNEGGIIGMAPKAHEKLREAGEGYEDFLRMGHFVDAVKKSNKPFREAAKDAADEVRKYHFDYDDFTQFEKMVMLRAFPFYKWTRKAAPMMMQALFLHPGRVIAPLKIQNTIANEITSTDVTDDPNGYLPNMDFEIPAFAKDMMLYQFMEEEKADGAGATLGKAPLPVFDVLKGLENPGQLGYGLLNPLVKAPIETAKEANSDGASVGSTTEEFFKNLTPQTKMGVKSVDEDGATPQDITNFMGLPLFKIFGKNNFQGGTEFTGGKY